MQAGISSIVMVGRVIMFEAMVVCVKRFSINRRVWVVIGVNILWKR